MAPPIFLDANVPMYAAGRPHALKEPCRQTLVLVAQHPRAFFTNSEVLQEILHRYRAIQAWPLGKAVFQDFLLLMRDRIEPVYARDVEAAAGLADTLPGSSSRDLVHLAVMARLGADRMVSADADFDRVPNVERLDPANLAVWRGRVGA